LLFLLTALVLLGATQARAEMIDFSYHWAAEPSPVIPGGTGSVSLAVAPDGNQQATAGSSVPVVIPGANVTTNSAATNPPDTFNTPFSMKLTLTDTASGATGILTFSGTISGTLTAGHSSLTSTFNNPLTETVTLGNHQYSVTIDPTLVNLPSPISTTPALIDALVVASDKNPGHHGGGGGGVPTAPEPSSLVLGATAVLGLAARRWVRARRGAAAARRA
jgi:hypothetical protein